MKQKNHVSLHVETREIHSILNPWFQQLRISLAFYLKLLNFLLVKPSKENVIFKNVCNIFLNVFCVKKLQLIICKNWRVRMPVTWGLALGFNRMKTTPDRSALAAGCTSTLTS